MPPPVDFDIIVIGEGIAGLSAARAAAEAGARAATFEAVLFGGLITNVNSLDPSPDFAVVSGADLVASLIEANSELGIESFQSPVTNVERHLDGFIVRAAGRAFRANQLVVASGARFRPLCIPGESELIGRGVSTCADCDGPLHRGCHVIVVGSGDSALQEALVLAQFCAKVTIVNRAAHFTGRANLGMRVGSRANISVCHGSELERIIGSHGVEGVSVRDLQTGHQTELACAAVFAYVGLAPNSEFLPGDIQLDKSGHVITNETLETTLPGAFAAGAVRQGCGGTLNDARCEGRTAGMFAAAQLSR